ncbi:hypothetical protein EMGBS6_16820 [Opitutia bacterium]|nr:hypothetical protein EMGBS6_16820 [Opitutae bacterium]
MYHNTDDLRIRSQHPLLTPALVLQELPASEKATEVVTTAVRMPPRSFPARTTV